MNLKDIAKQIRQDLKTEFGKKAKFSVRMKDYSKIIITIKEADESMFKSEKEFEQEHLGIKLENPILYDSLKYQFDNYETNRFKDETLDLIEFIGNKYNKIDSDPYTDYYNCTYYLSVVSSI